jgi:plastocyanin
MYSDENAQDAVAPMFVSGSHTGISYVYADASNVMNATVSSEYIQDQAAALLTAGTHSNISFNYVDASNRIDASVSLPAAYTDESAVDAVGAALTTGTHTGISFTYSSTQDAANRIDATVSYTDVVLTGTTTLQQSTKVLNNKTGSAGVSTFAVTNSGSSAYVINGVNNPTLNLVRGVTYTFNVNAATHPFWIKTAQATGTGSAYSTGVTNNGDDVGTITFAVPLDAPSTLYYICQIHSGMVGTLSISNAPIVVHDFATGDEFYHSGMLSNFTANFTNVPTTGDRVITVTVSLLQGSSPYGITAIQINGNSQTLRWRNNTVPTYGGLNSVDVATFTLFRTGASWIAIGDVVGY